MADCPAPVSVLDLRGCRALSFLGIAAGTREMRGTFRKIIWVIRSVHFFKNEPLSVKHSQVLRRGVVKPGD